MSGTLGPQIRYGSIYAWYLVGASLDLIVTWFILFRGGIELNAIADWVIKTGGLPGLLLYKFATVSIVVVICEAVGAARPKTGRWLAWLAVAVSFFPVCFAAYQFATRK